MKSFTKSSLLNNLVSKYVIFNKYSLYEYFKLHFKSPKNTIIVCILFIPFTILPYLFFQRKTSKEKLHQKNNFIYTLFKNGQLIKFQLKNYNIDVIEKIIYDSGDFYENDVLEQISKNIAPGFTILDIGANIGNHTLYFSKILQAKQIYSFEPIKETFKKLDYNVKLNACSNVVLYNFALGSSNSWGSSDNVSMGNFGAQKIKYSSEKKEFEIKTIDDLAIDKSIDFIKIDVEGFEEEVIKGGLKTIAKNKPLIFIEIHPKNFSKMKNLFEANHYSLIDSFSEDNYLFKAN